MKDQKGRNKNDIADFLSKTVFPCEMNSAVSKTQNAIPCASMRCPLFIRKSTIFPFGAMTIDFCLCEALFDVMDNINEEKQRA